MGKTTIYLNKEAEEIYRQAKEYAGDNLSAVIVQGLKLYVEKMDMMAKGMTEQVIFDGKRFMHEDICQGKNLKFIGMKLAEGSTEYGHGDEYCHCFTLYLTRKGKFLVASSNVDQKSYIENFFYKVFDTFTEVMAAGYPSSMLEEARMKMPEVACEELDV
ncbi:hypothetical protein [Geomobilimonas luticola]|uniref:Uncharacterized protein n=1 Tax=Geomobilimonas luticola TaxID=1114878 RepID=A0ABS5SE41_9BACT|nr:hypothetical protein [Geomobilimonas luticola]MBT0652907.1 hypothetical protein [Geomobilimonas luticola]